MRFSDKSHFNLALTLPSVNTLPISINCYTSNTTMDAVTVKLCLQEKNDTMKSVVNTYFWVYKVGTKLVVRGRNFNYCVVTLRRDFSRSHEHASE